MRNLRKIIYYKKVTIKRIEETEKGNKEVVFSKIIKKMIRKKETDIYAFSKRNMRFILFPKKLNCPIKRNNTYFLVAKYPNNTSKNYYAGKFTFGQIMDKLEIKVFLGDKFSKAQLRMFMLIFFNMNKEKEFVGKMKTLIEKIYNIKFEE